MSKVVTVGSALVDIFINSPNFKIAADSSSLECLADGGKLEVEKFALRTGGGSSNTAVGFARLGFVTTGIAELGKDELARLVVSDLTAAQVDISQLIQEKKEETGGSVILVAENGQRLVLVHRGAASMLDPGDINEEVLKQSDWIHVSSLSGQQATLQKIFAVGRDNKLRLSWNPGQREIDLLLSEQLTEPWCELLFVNKEEWARLAPRQAMLLRTIHHIIITDSDRGGQVHVDGQPAHTYQALPVTALDNTGAGDAFVVGYVAAHMRQQAVQTACQWGAKNAASVVQHLGAKAGLLADLSS